MFVSGPYLVPTHQCQRCPPPPQSGLVSTDKLVVLVGEIVPIHEREDPSGEQGALWESLRVFWYVKSVKCLSARARFCVLCANMCVRTLVRACMCVCTRARVRVYVREVREGYQDRRGLVHFLGERVHQAGPRRLV